MFFPTTRPCEPGPGHRPPQTVLHRHLLRMHPALTEVFRQNGDINQSIPETTLVRLNKVLRSADHGTREASCTLQAALAIVDTLIQKQEKTTSSLLSQAWRHKFRVVSQDIWKPAKSVLKLPQLTAAFSADETRANWSQRAPIGHNTGVPKKIHQTQPLVGGLILSKMRHIIDMTWVQSLNSPLALIFGKLPCKLPVLLVSMVGQLKKLSPFKNI